MSSFPENPVLSRKLRKIRDPKRSDLCAIVALKVDLGPAQRMRALCGGLRRIATLDQKPLVFRRLIRCRRSGKAKERLRAALQATGRKTRVRGEPGNSVAERIGRTGIH